jgi:hypothetical protein
MTGEHSPTTNVRQAIVALVDRIIAEHIEPLRADRDEWRKANLGIIRRCADAEHALATAARDRASAIERYERTHQELTQYAARAETLAARANVLEALLAECETFLFNIVDPGAPIYECEARALAVALLAKLKARKEPSP